MFNLKYCLIEYTSCGGTSNVIVLKSTVTKLSMHGRIKNKPGPLAPPVKILPKRNITYFEWNALEIKLIQES